MAFGNGVFPDGIGGGGGPGGEEGPQEAGHIVTAAESTAHYCIYELSVGTDKFLCIETLAARDKTTVSKRITLGWKSRTGAYIPIRHEQQAADVDAWVTALTKPNVYAAAIYMRIEDPALNDVLVLVFSTSEVKGT